MNNIKCPHCRGHLTLIVGGRTTWSQNMEGMAVCPESISSIEEVCCSKCYTLFHVDILGNFHVNLKNKYGWEPLTNKHKCGKKCRHYYDYYDEGFSPTCNKHHNVYTGGFCIWFEGKQK